MAVRRVTMQDIADACGLSRNTVSKIFNDRGAVPEATRRMVLEKAQALGYHQLPEEAANPDSRRQNIALFTSNMPTEYHFGTFFIPAFAGQLSRAGYTLMMVELSEEDLRLRRLPAQLSLEQIAGIMGIELFDRGYLDMLCGLGLPAIFVDAYSGANTALLNYDLISMENTASTIAMTKHLISAGARHIGFIGDTDHCNSFHERWIGFASALADAGLTLDRTICILDKDGPQYNDLSWIMSRLQAMPRLPDAFFCANDFLALRLMTVLKQMGVSIPDQVMVAGFDGLPQCAVVEPALSTIQIPSTDIGRLAADILLARIGNPDRPYCTTYVKTTPVLRASTSRSQK
ncbi:MAG: LacI family DNA-binding transcriptional regulator [Oscillospiraceae bacterium]|nr:LacI family DNA-binding transcriptional regulator [Oscillospiraceae bacterium]